MWQTNDRGVENVVIDYFNSIFQTNDQGLGNEVIDVIDCKVTPAMNSVLNCSFNPEKVRELLFQMHPSKSLGPDGMSLLLFQRYWSIMGNDVSNVVISILSSGHILRKISYIYMILILKPKNPWEMDHLRLISLCNVVYKIISKVIANRLKVILPQIISPNQIATSLFDKRRGKKGFFSPLNSI